MAKPGRAVFGILTFGILAITTLVLNVSQLPQIGCSGEGMSPYQLLEPLGSLGPAESGRRHLKYYDSLYTLSLQFGKDARTVLEVGCANDPFIQHLPWIKSKTCVAPYFVKYSNSTNPTSLTGSSAARIKGITADFNEWKRDKYYDLVICSQVAEHVPDPAAFVSKLVNSGKKVIVSVPYKWTKARTSAKAHHITHDIDLETIESWTHPKKPVLSTIVTDLTMQRILVVYEN